MLVVGGVTVGIGGAFIVARAMTGLLFGVSPADPLTFGVVTLGLAVVAMVACYLPARRAVRIDVVRAMRAS